MPDQWPRALLRAALREEGYDALGAPGLAAGRRYRPEAPARGPVRLVLVDQAAITDEDAPSLVDSLTRRHPGATMVLLARAHAPTSGVAPSVWRRVLRRPISIAEIVAAVQDLLPLPPGTARPLG